MKVFAKGKIIEDFSFLFSSFLEKDHNVCVNRHRIKNLHGVYVHVIPIEHVKQKLFRKAYLKLILSLCQDHKVVINLLFFLIGILVINLNSLRNKYFLFLSIFST